MERRSRSSEQGEHAAGVDFDRLRRGSSSRDDDRGSRDRDRDRGDDRRGDHRESSRDRGRDEPRDRGDDRRSSRDDDRGGRGSSRSSFEYQRRSKDDTRERAAENSKFDKFLDGRIKMWKPNDGENRIRILPPTWKGAKHYGYDIFMHYGVGADRQSYLCPHRMKDEPCSICKERQSFARDANTDNEDDKQYLKDLDAKQRVLVYIIDRDHERDGVQAWAMPESFDRDIVKISVDKETGEVLPIDHPVEGFDVTFDKSGTGMKTKYEGVSIARRSTSLGKDEWLEFAVDNPLPDQLIFFDDEHISKIFGGGTGPSAGKGRDDDRGRDSGRSRDDDRRGGSRDRDDREPSRDRDRGDDRRGGSRDRDDKAEYTWESIHDMKSRELEDLIEVEKLGINPREAKDVDDLADWVCEELKIKKEEPRAERGRDRDPPADTEDRMERMRTRLSRD